MLLQIDTTSKTIELLEEASFNELKEFIELLPDGQEYKIIPTESQDPPCVNSERFVYKQEPNDWKHEPEQKTKKMVSDLQDALEKDLQAKTITKKAIE